MRTPFGLPPFDEIRPDQFLPAFGHALAAHRTEVDAIANDESPPTFEVYSSGGTIDPAEAFGSFRGRDPVVGPMLARSGLVDDRQPA